VEQSNNQQGDGGQGVAAFGSRPIRVIVVDDHALVLDLLARAFTAEPDIEVIGTAGSIAAFAELTQQPHLRPDVVVMDRHLPDGTGLDGCSLAKARWHGVKVLVLAGSADPADVLAAIEHGADGYYMKTGAMRTVIDAIHSAVAGELLLTPELLGEIARELGSRTAEQVLIEPLTPRELTVLRLLAFGHATKTIAEELSMSQGTVRVHVEALRRKFQVSSKLEAVSAAIQHRIIEVPLA
jgi:DNA-binding NarL/FixJ family response regulator